MIPPSAASGTSGGQAGMRISSTIDAAASLGDRREPGDSPYVPLDMWFDDLMVKGVGRIDPAHPAQPPQPRAFPMPEQASPDPRCGVQHRGRGLVSDQKESPMFQHHATTCPPASLPETMPESMPETMPETCATWGLGVRPDLLTLALWVDVLNIALDRQLVTTPEHRQLLALLSRLRNDEALTTSGLSSLTSRTRLSLEDRGFLRRYTDLDSHQRRIALTIPSQLAPVFARLSAAAQDERRQLSESPSRPLDPSGSTSILASDACAEAS